VGIGRYTVVDKLGQGTFGQVMKCDTDDKEGYAIKIIRNKPAYTNQALVENLILSMVGPQNPYFLLPTKHYFLPLCRHLDLAH
jgi:dual specificity protein kinase YAK1